MKTIIVTEETIYSGIFTAMFEDIVLSKDAVILNTYVTENNRIRKRLFNILYKNKINSILKDCFEQYLHPTYSIIEEIEKYPYENICIIFTNASLQKFYSKNKLDRIKQSYPNVRFVLLLVDSAFQVQAKRAIELANENVFDLVYTYNEEDARINDYIYIQTPYSKLADVSTEAKPEVYFCGSDKGRADMLDNVADVLKNYGIKFRFEIYGKKAKSYRNFSVKTNGLRDYKEIVKDTLASNCILDLIQETHGQRCGLSLRVYESMVYRRALITNNPEILNFKFYDPRFMHYISKADDINPKWILNDGVPGVYSNELSPKYFLEDIRERLI